MAIKNLQVYLLALIIISMISYITLSCIQNHLTTTDCHRSTTTCTNIPSSILLMQDFTFIKSSNVCLNRSPSLIIVVHSAIQNFLRRDTIRSTWGSVKKYKGWTIELVFMLGIHSNSESNTHGGNSSSSNSTIQPPPSPPDQHDVDIVIGNFIDTYKNLTYKHLMGYKWALQHCPSAKYIIKVDDDIFLDTFHLIQIIENVFEMPAAQHYNNSNSNSNSSSAAESHDVSIIGNKLRHNKGRNEVYPYFVSGLGYVIKSSAACQLLKIQNSKPFDEKDDPFLTGVLRQELNLTIHAINSEYFIRGFPGVDSNKIAEELISWYHNNDSNATNHLALTPPPWTFILFDTKLLTAEMKLMSFWRIWFKTFRAYGISPGYGFND